MMSDQRQPQSIYRVVVVILAQIKHCCSGCCYFFLVFCCLGDCVINSPFFHHFISAHHRKYHHIIYTRCLTRFLIFPYSFLLTFIHPSSLCCFNSSYFFIEDTISYVYALLGQEPVAAATFNHLLSLSPLQKTFFGSTS